MSTPCSPDIPQTPASHDKGKGRAAVSTPATNEYNPDGGYFATHNNSATERTPLLPINRPPTPPFSPPLSTTPTLRRKLTAIFLTTFILTLLFFIALALLAWSYAARASHINPDDIIKKHFVFRGPERVDVLNLTTHGPGGEAGMWLSVQGRMGVDAASAIGVAPEEDDGPIRDIWKSIGRWGIGKLDTVTVRLSAVSVAPAEDASTVLAHLEIPSLQVPLSIDTDFTEDWLTRVQFPVFISPTKNTTALLHFLKESWRLGYVAVRAEAGEVVVRPGGVGGMDFAGWKARFVGRVRNVKTGVSVKIPPIPGLPTPGKHNPLPPPSSLVTLLGFSVETSNSTISLSATASALNLLPPALNTSFTVPPLPFVVSLPSESYSPSRTSKIATTALPIASVHTLPLPLPPATNPPTNITVHLTGTLLPLHKSTFPLLSAFLTRYLSGHSNTVLVTPSLPPSLPFSFPDIPLSFPAPNPRPKLLRDVTIKNMHIKATPRGDGFLASGTVYAKVVFPRGVDVDVDVWKVLPDVLVFDGEVPEDAVVSLPSSFPSLPTATVNELQTEENMTGRHTPPPSPPLPSPLPERAFGHIRPDDWLPSISEPVELEDGEEGGRAYVVTAQVVDIPLEVLPGRNKEFRDFVGKVIFSSSGALAGILGTAAVTVDVHGLPVQGGSGRDGRGTEIELAGLPFRGAVRVGKKGL